MYGALLIVQPPDGNTITSNYNRAVFLSGPGMSGDLVILHFSTLLTVGWPSKCVLWPPMASETRCIYLVRQWNQKAIGHQALLCRVAMVPDAQLAYCAKDGRTGILDISAHLAAKQVIYISFANRFLLIEITNFYYIF